MNLNRSRFEGLYRRVEHFEGTPRALDLGAGVQNAQKPAESAGFRYRSLDIRDRFSPDVVGDAANRLPFESESFFLVIAKEILEHVEFPHFTAREIHRVLEPGGVLIGSVPFMWPVHSDRDFWLPTRQGLEFILNSAGFIAPSIRPRGGPLSIGAVPIRMGARKMGLKTLSTWLKLGIYTLEDKIPALNREKWAASLDFEAVKPTDGVRRLVKILSRDPDKQTIKDGLVEIFGIPEHILRE